MTTPGSRPAMIGNLPMNRDRTVRRSTRRELKRRAPAALSDGQIDPLTPGTCAVYRLWNHGGVLLYVGIADDPKSRWRQHRGDKSWWGDVYRKSVTWYLCREAAQAAESKAIQEEWPLYNRAGVDDSPTNVVITASELLAELGHKDGRRVGLWRLYQIHSMVNAMGSIRELHGARLPIDRDSLREAYGEIYRGAGETTRRVHMWLADNVYNVRALDGYEEHAAERDHFYDEQRESNARANERFLAEQAKRQKGAKPKAPTSSKVPRRKRAPSMAELKELSPDLRDAVKAAVTEEVKRQKAAANRRPSTKKP